MAFAKEMVNAKHQLEQRGHVVFIPEGTYHYTNGEIDKKIVSGSEGAKRKIANDLIRKHCQFIDNSDAILVLNYEKNGVSNYIGGNSFLEIGYAHIINKKIFLMNEIPEIELFRQEIEAVQPIVIYGNLDLING